MKSQILEILEKFNINGFSFNGGTDKATDHSYDGYYNQILQKYKGRNIDILEIGVQYGGSSLLWHEFFENSKIVMMDIVNIVHPSIFERMDSSRYEFIQGDAYKENSIEILKSKYPNGFDIIIDDGPHTLNSQLYCILEYTKLVKSGGILIIEDVQSLEDAKILINSLKETNYKEAKIVNLTSIKGRWDDILIVIEK